MCPHCNKSVFWPDSKVLASYETYLPRFFSESPISSERLAYEKQQEELALKFKDTPEYTDSVAAQVYEYLQTHKVSADHELALRLQYWGQFNDERITTQRIELLCEERENLEELQKKIDHNEQELLLLHAELSRELGKFEEAIQNLDFDFRDDLSARAEQLILAIENKSTMPFDFVRREDQYEFEYAWTARRFFPDDASKYNFADLKPPVFKISNRDWWIKVLGMLAHNWVLIDRNPEGTATVYFFRDCPHGDRPAIVDSIEFNSVIDAREGLMQNGFKRLKDHPGPWMGCEPKGFICDKRNEADKIYSNGNYWK
jgi:hypothetical protein